MRFGSTTASSFTVTSPTTITAVTNGHVAGTVPVQVTTPRGTNDSAHKFTFLTPPAVTSITPASGPVAGGTAVTIFGTGFTEASAVTFGQTSATTVSVD